MECLASLAASFGFRGVSTIFFTMLWLFFKSKAEELFWDEYGIVNKCWVYANWLVLSDKGIVSVDKL